MRRCLTCFTRLIDLSVRRRRQRITYQVSIGDVFPPTPYHKRDIVPKRIT